VRPGLDALEVRPRLPEGIDTLSASFRLRGRAITLGIRRTHTAPSARLDGRKAQVSNGALLVSYDDLKTGPPGGTAIEMEVL
ncbi:MAG TPA: glycosyl hydrolase family 65 protein, partial [Bacteroidota bacterium]|nr:glycosyl hydrolase family 65 protein [Bacteroidota bacterium]